MTRNLAICLETVGICAILAGISVEVALGAHIGWVLITGGSVTISTGGLLWAKVIRKGR